MSAEPPAASGTDSGDPAGARYPSTARIWNYQLGGTDNFAVDRKASDAANAMVRALGVPDGADTAVESRHLLQRMVDYLLGQGVRQFLDLGSGLPNMASTHQIAQRAAPGARVVYVDNDPLVSAYAATQTAGPDVVMLQADLREPGQVLNDPQVRGLFDFGQPVGIMFMCVLHCIARFFDGFTLVEPGLVAPAQWRPDLDDPLRNRQDPGGDGEPVLKPIPSGPPAGDRGIGWHLCGVGIKDQP